MFGTGAGAGVMSMVGGVFGGPGAEPFAMGKPPGGWASTLFGVIGGMGAGFGTGVAPLGMTLIFSMSVPIGTPLGAHEPFCPHEPLARVVPPAQPQPQPLL